MDNQTALTTIEPSNALTLPAPERLDQNAAAVYLAGLAQGSRPTMQGALNTIAAMLTNGNANALTLDWSQIRFSHAAAVRSRLTQEYAAPTANKILCALRGTLKTCWRLGQMNADDYQRATDLDAVRGETLPSGRALTSGEIAALLDACARDISAAGARDAAMLAILYSCGLRRAELSALEISDYDAVNETLRVHGKRNKTRLVPIVNGAKNALDDWLHVRGSEPGAMFCPVSKGGRVVIRHMFPEAIFFMLQKRAEQAGIKDLSPHDLRRTFVSDLLDAGADISTVQKMAGHANVNTTQRYDRRDAATKRKAASLLHVPYRGRVVETFRNVR